MCKCEGLPILRWIILITNTITPKYTTHIYTLGTQVVSISSTAIIWSHHHQPTLTYITNTRINTHLAYHHRMVLDIQYSLNILHH